jgi:hypothetical protein
MTFAGGDVPNFWQSFDNLSNPTVTSQGTLEGGLATVPDRFMLASWPDIYNTIWDYTTTPGKIFGSSGYPDSAVAMYWEPDTLGPNATQEYVTYYGLAHITTEFDELALGVTGQASLTIEGDHYSTLDVVAYVQNTNPGAVDNVELTLTLPNGLELAPGENGTQAIGSLNPGQDEQVDWEVIATPRTQDATLTYSVTASGTGVPDVTVQRSVFVPALLPPPAELWFVEYQWGPDPAYEWDPFPITFRSSMIARVDNVGGGDAYNVTATIMDAPANVTIIDGDLTLGDISAGGSAWSSDTYMLEVDMSNPQDPSLGVWWRIVYECSLGNQHIVENVPQFRPAPSIAPELPLWYPRIPEYKLCQDLPSDSRLHQNYPNPFNPETWIPYQLAQPADVTVRVFGAKGELLRTISLGSKEAGFHTGKSQAAYWDGRNEFGESVGSGVYYCNLRAGDFSATRRMIILK